MYNKTKYEKKNIFLNFFLFFKYFLRTKHDIKQFTPTKVLLKNNAID